MFAGIRQSESLVCCGLEITRAAEFPVLANMVEHQYTAARIDHSPTSVEKRPYVLGSVLILARQQKGCRAVQNHQRPLLGLQVSAPDPFDDNRRVWLWWLRLLPAVPYPETLVARLDAQPLKPLTNHRSRVPVPIEQQDTMSPCRQIAS